MLKRVVRESPDGIPGLVLGDGEHIRLCLHTGKRVRNPMDSNKSYPETAVVTNKRLVVMAQLSWSKGDVVFTSMPLEKIESVQTTFVGWTFMRVLACIAGFLVYVIPGIIYLIYMSYASGAAVNAVAGVLRAEVRFSAEQNELLRRFVAML